jgi:N-acetylmuramoyl-L-alanine amidase
LCLCALVLSLIAQEQKTLTVFAPQGTFSVALRDRNNVEYVPLLEVLQRAGAASGSQDGKKVTVRFNGADSGFQAGKAKAKVHGKSIDLGGPVEIDQGALLVPVSGLAKLLSRFLDQPVELRAGGRRLILVPPIGFQSELVADPSRLVIHFSRPVSPHIATETGRLRLNFDKDPVTATDATQTFPDKLIAMAAYSEANGTPTLTVRGSAPLLATFSDEGRTITIAAAPQAAAQTTPPTPAPLAATPPPAAPAQSPAPPAAAARPRYVVVIDPAHGGSDRGAALANGVDEKTLTLALARRLRAALEASGISVLLLRDGDTNLTAEQRAIAANSARPAVYIGIHAADVGEGVRTYTARMVAQGAPASPMLPWDTAQAAYLDRSRELMASIAAQLSHASLNHAEGSAQLQPLQHLTSAAVELEFLPGPGGVASLMLPEYQQRACAAIAAGIAASRRVQEARR